MADIITPNEVLADNISKQPSSNQQQWQKALLDWTILMLCPFSIAVDLVNGFLLLTGAAAPLSLVFKAGILTLVIIRIAITDLRIATGLLALTFLLSLPSLRIFLIRGEFSLFFIDISLAIRVLFFLSFMLYIVLTQPTVDKINFILKVLTVSIAVNLAFGVLGFGFATYSVDEGFGIKGFIFSGNELAITIIALSYFVMFSWVKHKSWPIQMTALILVLLCGALVATKSAMLGTIIIVGLFLFLNSRKTFFATLLICIFSIILFADALGELIKVSGIIERFLFVYHKRGIISLIFSAREAFFLTNLQFTLDNFGLFGWFFGWGQGAYVGFVKPKIEIDILDMFFLFGLTGLISFLLYFYLVYRLICIRNNFIHLASFTIWLLILVISCFAGHVVYSGLAAIPLTLAIYATSHRQGK
ncbi:hypothetical protein GPUN_2859 [Glaciecola punicea ACAM 611]|uniref:O-antigen polymerase n=1 Tax=Glaciecola punicea ACAM 611 TaxID=1121923 RepID=H5TF46_9ALTE|nr:hypothetical protein [Glaciecola punicea]GAB56973.1 hypothetical protein GPUN_2859 [Glaciecola punicea ACAM 611]